MVIRMHTKHIQSPLDHFQTFHTEGVIDSKVLGKSSSNLFSICETVITITKSNFLLGFWHLSKGSRLLNGLVEQKGVFLLWVL